LKADWLKYRLNFLRPSGTSRGVLDHKDSYFLRLTDDQGRSGVGECSLLPKLSPDLKGDVEAQLDGICRDWLEGREPLDEHLAEFPALRFGVEMAKMDLQAERGRLFPSDFTDGLDRQAINGLIWMGSAEDMHQQIRSKMEEGFLVLKMKIGAIGFEEELALLKSIRSEYRPGEIQLRVDANGAFSPQEAADKLNRLFELHIHSIEQPIAAGQWEEMARLCELSPLDIALDEELIGVQERGQREALLDAIKPRYLILKPSLLGGFASCEEWIELIEARVGGWWVTSALESNIGLSAIAQWNYTLHGFLASGLGTGGLFANNFDSPLSIVRGTLCFDPAKDLEKPAFK